MRRHMPALDPGAAGAPGMGMLCPASSQGGVYLFVSLWDPMGCGAYLPNGQHVCKAFVLECKFSFLPVQGMYKFQKET